MSNVSRSDARPKLITVHESLGYIGVGRTKFYDIVKCGAIRPVKVGRRTLVIRAELDAWIDSLPRIGERS